jgi:hypothetical protein
MMKSSGIGNTHHGDWQCNIQRGSIQLRRYAKSTLNHTAGDSITVHHTYNVALYNYAKNTSKHTTRDSITVYHTYNVALYNYAKNTSNHTARDSITGSVSYVCGSLLILRTGMYNTHRNSFLATPLPIQIRENVTDK